MSTKGKTSSAEETPQEQHPLFETARKVLLAAIGAVALAQDELEEFVNRLIERGEIAEKDGRKLLNEIREKRKKQAERAEEEINRRVEAVLERMRVPTKADIEALNEKNCRLGEKSGGTEEIIGLPSLSLPTTNEGGGTVARCERLLSLVWEA